MLKLIADGIFITLLLVMYFGIFFFVLPSAVEDISRRYRRRLVGDIVAQNGKTAFLTRKQIEIISKDFRITTRDTQILLGNQFVKAVKAGNEPLIAYFQELYEQLERDEPFEGLPSDVRLHLERIREAIGEDRRHLMEPLAAQLRDLSAANRKKEKWMWGLTIASLAAGLIGVVVSVVPYVSSTSPKAEASAASRGAPALEVEGSVKGVTR